MKKTRMEKGITLIALIITIVVLLILAAVAISSITNDGILGHATNAAKDYNQAVKDEQSMLEYYQGYLAGTLWEQNGTTITRKNEDGTMQTIEVGDYVNYISEVEGYTDTNGWRVLGVENGKILLLSTEYVVSNYTLTGSDACINGINKLNSQCVSYGKGEYAESARSIEVEDVNRITGYNPYKTGNGTIYGEGVIHQYGNEVTYTIGNEGKVDYASKIKSGTSSSVTYFKMPDGRVLGTDMTEVRVGNNYYAYYPKTLTESNSDESKGLEVGSVAYLMLFRKVSDTSKYLNYWLADIYENGYGGAANFGLRKVQVDCVSGQTEYNSEIGNIDSTTNLGVRAVVILKSNTTLTSSGANSWVLGK